MKIIRSSNSNLVGEFKHTGQYLHTIEENKELNKLPTEHAASSSSSPPPPPVPPKASGIKGRFVSWNNASLSNMRASSPFKDWRVSKNNTVRKSTASSSSASASSPSLPLSAPSSSCGPPNQKQECMICFDDFEEMEIFHTSQCRHYMCRQCLTTYLTTYTEARHDDYARIPCPGHQCTQGSFDSQDIVSRVMSPTAADAWWFKIIRRDVLESYGYCPYSDCKAMFELDEVELEQQRLNRAAAQQTRDTTRTGFAKTLFRRRLRRQSQPPPQPQRTMVECPKCHRGICLWCEHPWHDDICKERPTGRWRRKHDVSEMLLQNEMNRQNSIAARQLALQQGWTRCPHCREVVARSYGCNAIKCRCGYEFCYLCGSRSRSHNCLGKCHQLSAQQVQELRNKMYEKSSSEMGKKRFGTAK
ncbi:predicted protein [Lichtheimia corymbifera JMRC:FSU:9682]|uniref:RBR-type E3 ubiquitin transferase n=1 Tax=Lichtheimia corymbifera JMRC:FSU:9682 TaxID=1263082 RepID=A0A068RK26_9FUNG|nr:predicted protein [Lichtheimia corymbifera JMRC:FSU:9682]